MEGAELENLTLFMKLLISYLAFLGLRFLIYG